jgi:1,4-dihydroxy-2-naphthoate octaprenyltransferase
MQPSSMQSWFLAIRPRTLPAAIGPLLIGNMLAIGLEQFSLLIAVTSMLCAVLLTLRMVSIPKSVSVQ